MSDAEPDWRELLRAELEQGGEATDAAIDEVGRLLLLALCSTRPATAESRPYRRFDRFVRETLDERKVDESNFATFSPRPGRSRSDALELECERFDADAALSGLATMDCRERGEQVIRLLQADVRFLLHPAVAGTVVEWHLVIRAVGHKASQSSELQEGDAREFVTGLAQLLARGQPQGAGGRPDRSDFDGRARAARRSVSKAVRRYVDPAVLPSRVKAERICKELSLPVRVADALCLADKPDAESAVDEVLAAHYEVNPALIRKWRRRIDQGPGSWD